MPEFKSMHYISISEIFKLIYFGHVFMSSMNSGIIYNRFVMNLKSNYLLLERQ